MIEFECKQCGTYLYLSPKESEEPHCPQCRGAMKKTGGRKKASELARYKCPDCGKIFHMRKNISPYKCPFSNYTFAVSPRVKQEERL